MSSGLPYVHNVLAACRNLSRGTRSFLLVLPVFVRGCFDTASREHAP